MVSAYSLPTLVLCLSAASRISVPTDSGKRVAADRVDDAFAQYARMYNKSYSGTERAIRLSAFKDTLRRIARRTSSAVYGLTRYSDMTAHEFRTLFSPGKRAANLTDQADLLPYPPRFDWRTRNVITAVRNQRSCGACWAFSTVECMETMNAIKSGLLTELSVQQMIDCSRKQGCNGGDTCAALEWLKTARLVESSVYPFTGATGECRTPPSAIGVRLREYTCGRFVGREDVMLGLLANHGPLVAAVDASAWQDYLGGIVQYHCEAGRNHAVQIVGYDTTGDVPYYVLRNSWGTDFGHDGYLYVAVGKNLCGIAEEVALVEVA